MVTFRAFVHLKQFVVIPLELNKVILKGLQPRTTFSANVIWHSVQNCGLNRCYPFGLDKILSYDLIKFENTNSTRIGYILGSSITLLEMQEMCKL